MKIRLTESQYNRLIKEDDKSFLDGDLDFMNIDNKVTPVVSKIYMVLKNKNFEPSIDYLRLKNPIESITFRKIAEEIRNLTGYQNDEVILLTHNYCTVLWENIKNTAETQQQVAQQQAQDPLIQMQQQELQLKAQEVQIKAQKTMADIEIDKARLQLDKAKMDSQERIEGVKIGAKTTFDKEKLQADQQTRGVELGMQAVHKQQDMQVSNNKKDQQPQE